TNKYMIHLRHAIAKVKQTDFTPGHAGAPAQMMGFSQRYGQRLRGQSHQLNQAHDTTASAREQPRRQTVLITNDPKRFDTTNTMLNTNAYRGERPVLLFLLWGQFAPARLLVRNLRVGQTLVSQVSLHPRVGKAFADFALLMQFLVRLGTRITRVNGEDLSVYIGEDLGL